METLEGNKFIEFNKNQLEDVRKVYNYDINRLKQDIELFEEWISKQNHFRVRKFDRGYLERYLLGNKGSIERAKKHFDNLCTNRNLMPEFLQNIDVKNEFGPLKSCCTVGILPKPTADNYRVSIIKLHGHHEDMTIEMYLRYIIAFLQYLLYHDYCLGWVSIFDTREMHYSTLMKMNPIVFSKGLKLMMESLSQRIKGFHFLSGSKFLDTFVNICTQALSDKLKKRIQIHGTMQSLHQFVDKDTLPPEYDGNGKSLQQLDDILFEAICSEEHIARLKFLETSSTDESCRLSSKFNEEYSGMAGSFKSMVLD